MTDTVLHDSTPTPPDRPNRSIIEKLELNNPVFWFSGSFLLAFVILAFTNNALLTQWVNTGFSWAVAVFGPYWQLLLLFTFIIGLMIAASSAGHVRLGKLDKPETSTFQWLAVILCTLLAGGGVFWAAAGPIANFVTPPPIFGPQDNLYQQAINALAQSFVHWGFLSWSILGALTAIVLMHLHYDRGLPLKPRTLLYPVLGERALKGYTGALIDACCIIAVAAGTIGPVGFLGLQISYALHTLFQIPDAFVTQMIVVMLAIAIYTLSALSGLNRGIQILSRYNVYLAVALMLYILIFGPTGFIVNAYIQGMGSMIDNFIPITTYRGDVQWLSRTTIFFWGWFLGYGPLMAVFIARISRGRTIRELIVALCIIAPVITCFWFTIVGGSGLSFELTHPGSVSGPFAGFNLPASLLAITQQMAYIPTVISVLFLVLTTIFIVTTGDSMTYCISVVISGDISPNAFVRAFWGIMMGVTAIILIANGDGGISALQSFIVITAVPVSLVLLPSLWNAPQMAKRMAKEQGFAR